MAKKGAASGKRKGGDDGKRARRRELTSLERQLDELMAREQQLDVKLARTRERIVAAKDRIRELGGPEAEVGDASAGASSSGPIVTAYCLRERRRVELTDGTPITLRNGRAAFAGTCPSCGMRIVSLAARHA